MLRGKFMPLNKYTRKKRKIYNQQCKHLPSEGKEQFKPKVSRIKEIIKIGGKKSVEYIKRKKAGSLTRSMKLINIL